MLHVSTNFTNYSSQSCRGAGATHLGRYALPSRGNNHSPRAMVCERGIKPEVLEDKP